MTLPTSDMWFSDDPLALLAICIHSNLLAEEPQDRSGNVRGQANELAGIRAPDAGNRTVLTQ